VPDSRQVWTELRIQTLADFESRSITKQARLRHHSFGTSHRSRSPSRRSHSCPRPSPDAVFHSAHVDPSPVGGAPLQSGVVEIIHTDGPTIFAHDSTW
jgi:hypothetical protein